MLRILDHFKLKPTPGCVLPVRNPFLFNLCFLSIAHQTVIIKTMKE